MPALIIIACGAIVALLWARNAATSAAWAAEAAAGNDAPQDTGGDAAAADVGADPAPSPTAGLLESLGAAVMGQSGARGIKNNNPGNIRKSPIAWQGKTGNDGVFEIFATAFDGIRALARNLLAYQLKHGDATIEQIITRWAPASENDTKAYINHVAAMMNTAPNAALDLKNPATLDALTRAIITHENGNNPYDAATVAGAVNAAIS